MSTEPSERLAFEKWADDQGFSLQRTVTSDGEDYQDLRTQGPWDAWQVRSALAAAEVAKERALYEQACEQYDTAVAEVERQKIIIDGCARIYVETMKALRETVDERDRLRTHAVVLAETARVVEQERCAKVCEDWGATHEPWITRNAHNSARHLASAIRSFDPDAAHPSNPPKQPSSPAAEP